MLNEMEPVSGQPGSPPRQWALTGRFGAGMESRVIPVTPLPFTIGRRPDASLTLSRPTVSGLHAELVCRDNQLYVRDYGSTNGTFVNGERVLGEVVVHTGAVLQFADVPFQLSCEVQRSESRTMCENVCDHAMALVQFRTLMKERAVIPFFQPIVDLHEGRIEAFEVLARSRMVGLESAGAMFGAAAELGTEAELSRLMRVKGMGVSGRFIETPHLFLNTHPIELAQDASFEWLAELRTLAPSQKLTLEIHEAAVTDITTMLELRRRLEELGIGIAFDDFGSGQARIAELSEVRPDFLKFDRRIIKDIDLADRSRRTIVKCLVEAVHEIGIIALAEGVETKGEHEACRDIGFAFAQGYYFGKPEPVEKCNARYKSDRLALQTIG